jgi:hypothetical protein
MKTGIVLGLLIATTTAQTPAGGRPPSEFGNIIGSLQAMFASISKALTDAGIQIMNGTPANVVFEQTLPKIFPEAKLLNRIDLPATDAIRPGVKRARASFGPYVLVGKNVSTPARKGIDSQLPNRTRDLATNCSLWIPEVKAKYHFFPREVFAEPKIVHFCPLVLE